MGLCFSKKKRAPCDTPATSHPPPPPPPSHSHGNNNLVKKKDKPAVLSNKGAADQQLGFEKKSVFVVTPNAKSVDEKKKKKKVEVPTKKPEIKNEAGVADVPVEEVRPKPVPVPVPVPVRTSSCTKEEVDAILIQCGRLSRSSSGKTSNETAGGGGGAYRRYSGSKRSFDFDHERKGEEEYDEERAVSRPSPHRRTPGRERSGSRERGAASSGGSHSRRVSRSPGRRTDGPTAIAAASGNEKTKPAKMVSVPAREKAAAADQTGSVKKGSTGGTVSAKRNASPRSRSPAASNTLNTSIGGGNENAGTGAQPTLSRNSSSRKTEHSPYRRNPMAEIDDNLLKGNQNGSVSFRSQKGNQAQSQSQKSESMISSHKGSVDDTKTSRSHNIVTNCIRDQFVTCRVKDQENNTEEPFDPLGSFKSNEINFTNISLDSLNTKAVVSTNRASRRSSRDFDHHGNSYTNIILEDIQNYHQNNTNSASQNPISFTIPECVSKACSILDAVADLNSSSSEGRNVFKPKEPFLESEVAVKNDLMEPSMHKYVSVRDLGAEVEPQESAGSNSVAGQPWASTWEPNSVDSTDRYLAGSQSNNREEIEQEGPVGEARQARHDRRLVRGGSSVSGATGGSNNVKKRETVDRQINRNGTGGVRPGTRGASTTASASASAC